MKSEPVEVTVVVVLLTALGRTVHLWKREKRVTLEVGAASDGCDTWTVVAVVSTALGRTAHLWKRE